MSSPELSVVVPVYNEAAVIEELVRRCREAAQQVTGAWELILVDDHSDDATPELLVGLADGVRVHHLRLPRNVGQFRATRAGLRASRGEHVIVLDGDLQDPPEVIVTLAEVIRGQEGEGLAVFAVKTERQEHPVFRLGRFAYGFLTTFAAWRVPPGSGSFCAMTGDAARRIGAIPTPWGNLAPFVAAASGRSLAVAYDKEARYDGRSRVGALGLVVEAVSTLAMNGSFERLALAVSFAFLVLGQWPVSLGWALAALIFRGRRGRLERLIRGNE